MAGSRLVDANRQPVEQLTIITAQHERLWTTRKVARIAIGDQSIASISMISSREVLILGRKPGRSSVTVWFSDGLSQVFVVSVQSDLSVLQSALEQIHSTLTVSAAPDREAIILRGKVPTLHFAQAAQEATAAYLRANSTRRRRNASVRAPTIAVTDGAGETFTVRRANQNQDAAWGTSAIINLIQVLELPPDLVERMNQALTPIDPRLKATRVQHGQLPNDTVDTVVIEGQVDDPAALTRLVQVASRILGDPNGRQVQVVADDSGAMAALGIRGQGGAGAAGAGGAGAGQRGGANGGSLPNLSISRARALSLARGRGLVFVDVGHLPQVSIAVRLYEINRAKLRDLRSSLTGADAAITGGTSTTPPTTNTSANPASTTIVRGLEALLNVQQGMLTGGFSLNHPMIQLQHLMHYLETTGVARSLSSPSLTVLSGENAMFQMGGDVPVPQLSATNVGGAQGANAQLFTTVASFREFGVRLQLRPLVHASGEITLHLRPEVSEPDAGLTASLRQATGSSQGAPAFNRRMLDTTARLRDGESLVVGGLFTRRTSLQDGSNPVLARIPLFGWLFQQWGESDDERELLIVVEPTLQREVSPKTRHWLWPRVWKPKVEAKEEPSTTGDASAPSDQQVG